MGKKKIIKGQMKGCEKMVEGCEIMVICVTTTPTQLNMFHVLMQPYISYDSNNVH